VNTEQCHVDAASTVKLLKVIPCIRQRATAVTNQRENVLFFKLSRGLHNPYRIPHRGCTPCVVCVKVPGLFFASLLVFTATSIYVASRYCTGGGVCCIFYDQHFPPYFNFIFLPVFILLYFVCFPTLHRLPGCLLC